MMIMEPKLFFGDEVEGKPPLKGKCTLFVQGDAFVKDILKAFEDPKRKVKQIYFGANFKKYTSTPSFVRWATVKEVLKALTDPTGRWSPPLITFEFIESTIDYLDLRLLNASVIGVQFIRVTESIADMFLVMDMYKQSAILENLVFKFVTHVGVILIKATDVAFTPRGVYEFLNDTEIHANNS